MPPCRATTSKTVNDYDIASVVVVSVNYCYCFYYYFVVNLWLFLPVLVVPYRVFQKTLDQ
jgi:hypothetical protein